MSNCVVGVDPDSEAHGIAIYEDGQLCTLCRMTTVDVVDWLGENSGKGILFSVENTLYTNTIYAKHRNPKATVMGKIGLSIGRVQQAQIELMRWLDKLQVMYILHKPQRGNWADDRKQFERVTGWCASSNKDTRAAAYFGFLETKEKF